MAHLSWASVAAASALPAKRGSGWPACWSIWRSCTSSQTTAHICNHLLQVRATENDSDMANSGNGMFFVLVFIFWEHIREAPGVGGATPQVLGRQLPPPPPQGASSQQLVVKGTSPRSRWAPQAPNCT